MIRTEDGQLDFHSNLLEQLVRSDHPYRKIISLINFKQLTKPLHELYSKQGCKGIAVESGFKCLLLQLYEDLSDRQMERALQENVTMKWFCGLGLTNATPDHSYFGKLRKRIGTEKLAELFNAVNDELRQNNLISDVFTFVDATGLVSKVALWEERDKAIKDGLEKLNNEHVSKYATDKDARFGCRGKHKFWFGYKRHVAVDMRHGLIKEAAVTPANLPDAKALEKICPNGGMVLGDKGYSGKTVAGVLAKRGCHSGVILKNNMKGKNRDKDRWLTGLRMPYEGVFARMPRRARYRGIVKVEFQVLFEALAFNIRRLVKIGSPPILTGS